MRTGRLKSPLYTLQHGIEVIGEYPARGKNRYWRVRIRPHRFFPGVPIMANGMYVRRSRVVLASKLGRALQPSEHAHHRDENPHRDVPRNLKLLTAGEHNRHHKTGTRHRAESKAKTSATLKRAYATGARIPKPMRGSQQGSSKITEADAAVIKHCGERTRDLVKRYGLSKTIINKIKRGALWKHVP